VDITIREATLQDYEGLCEVFEEGDALHRDVLHHIFRKPDGPVRTKEYISGIIADENRGLFVAQVGSQIVGIVHVALQEAAPIPIKRPRRYALIENLVVAEKVRRSGIGRALVEKAHDWALSKGLSEVELMVWEFNEGSRSFYEQLGYTTASRKMWKKLK